MEEKNYEAIIEAILFTMGESVELDKIANAIELDKQETKKKIEALQQKYEQEERGIQIIELDGAYQMCTKNEMYEYLIRIANSQRSVSLQTYCWRPYPSLLISSQSLRRRLKNPWRILRPCSKQTGGI